MSDEVDVRKADPKKLILAVKKRPCLWNSSCPEYRMKTVKKDAWDEVAAEVIDDWNEFTRTEKHVNMRFLIRRWNNTRDYFNKSIKANYLANLHGPPDGPGRRKYAFADLLRFLRPELEKKLSGLAHELETGQAVKFEIEEHSEEETDKLEEEEEEATITFVDTLDQPLEEFNYTAKKLRHNLSGESVRREEDPDLMFLKSLLPDMKKLKDDEKFAFKYAIMDAYMGIIKKRNNSK